MAVFRREEDVVRWDEEGRSWCWLWHLDGR